MKIILGGILGGVVGIIYVGFAMVSGLLVVGCDEGGHSGILCLISTLTELISLPLQTIYHALGNQFMPAAGIIILIFVVLGLLMGFIASMRVSNNLPYQN